MPVNPALNLPSFDHLFAASATVLPVHAAAQPDKDAGAADAGGKGSPAIVKINGAGDSAGRATNVKAPGGHDANGQRDGG